MDAILAFDPYNYPFLLEFNSQFLDVVTRIACKLNLVQASSRETCRRMLAKSENEELSNVLVLILAPYVTNLRVLRQESFPNPFTDIVKSVTISFFEYMGHVILHVRDSNKNGKVSRSNIKITESDNNLYYFVELLKFAFGTNPMSARLDTEQANLVLSLYRHWVVNSSNPIYATQATERLLVSANLKATLTLVLQSVLSKCRQFLKFYGEVPSQALMFVGGKFTSEFSSQCSCRISKRDLILLQILLESKCLPKAYSHKANGSNGRSLVNDGEDLDYFADTESDMDSTESSRSRRDLRPTTELNHLPDIMIPLTSIQNAPSYLLFLENSKDVPDLRLPYCVRIVKLSETVVILILSELTSRFVARSIHSILRILTGALCERNNFNGFNEFPEFERSCNSLKKLLERNGTKASKQLIDRIGLLINSGFRKYCTAFSTTDLPIRIDALASSVCSTLRDYYNECVFQFESSRMKKISGLEQVRQQMEFVRIFSREQSSLYIEYLEVKSKINMTVEPYVQVVPGLKAFVYIDRKVNTVVYASVDHKFRDLLVQAVTQSYCNLAFGHLSSNFVINDLSAYYFHWFESFRGDTMKPAITSFRLQSYPCLMRSDFLEEILAKCFPCKRQDSFSCWGKDPVSSYEILVLCKSGNRSRATASATSSPSTLSPANDMEVKCKRLASKLSEFVAPEHFVSSLF